MAFHKEWTVPAASNYPCCVATPNQVTVGSLDIHPGWPNVAHSAGLTMLQVPRGRDFDLRAHTQIAPYYTQVTQWYVCDTLGIYSADILPAEYNHNCYCCINGAFRQFNVSANIQQGVMCLSRGQSSGRESPHSSTVVSKENWIYRVQHPRVPYRAVLQLRAEIANLKEAGVGKMFNAEASRENSTLASCGCSVTFQKHTHVGVGEDRGSSPRSMFRGTSIQTPILIRHPPPTVEQLSFLE